MKLVLIICSKETVLDRSTNMTSVFNIFDDINTPSFPVFLAPFTVLTVFEKQKREPDKQRFELLIHVAGQKILSQEIPLEFQGKQRIRNTVQYSGLPVSGPGLFEVSASKNNELLGRYWFHIEQVGPIKETIKEENTAEISRGVLIPMQITQQPHKKRTKNKKA
jgi:hypothetical protein